VTVSPFGEVRIVGLPVDVHRRSSEHSETLRRELALLEHTSDPSAAPARLQTLSDELTRRYGGLTVGQDDRLAEAISNHEETIDLTYQLPLEVADAVEDLIAVLEELDRFCHDGDLLTLVTPPEALAYRRWFLGEFVGQLRDGRAPTAWQPPLEARPAPTTSARGVQEALIVLERDLDLELASSLRDEILAHTEAGVRSVAIDVSAVRFIDSAGVSLLLTSQLRLEALGGTLRVVGANGQVAQMLARNGLSEVLGAGV
jgi:anti-anti-sigma factor